MFYNNATILFTYKENNQINTHAAPLYGNIVLMRVIGQKSLYYL